MKWLQIEKAKDQVHPSGVLWTNVNEEDGAVFLHFSGGLNAVVEGSLRGFEMVAEAHGWKVVKEVADGVREPELLACPWCVNDDGSLTAWAKGEAHHETCGEGKR